MLKKFKTILRALLLSNATPREVSEGFAIGTFIAFTPTLGFHTWIALGLATLLKKNKIATLIGAYLTNPITVIPVFYFNFRLGEYLIGRDQAMAFNHEILLNIAQLGSNILIPLWIGSLAVAIPTTVVSYYLSLKLYPRIIQKFRKHPISHAR